MRSEINKQDLTTAVTNQVKYLTESGLMFTAHDVTQLVRKTHPDKEINHPDVRFIVRDMFPDDFPVGYTRTLKDDNPNGPFIYHEVDDDVTIYDKFYRAYSAGVVIDDSSINPNNPVSDYGIGTTVIGRTSSGLPVGVSISDSNGFTVTPLGTSSKLALDKWGRVRIPKSYTESIGLNPFDAVNVTKENGCSVKIEKSIFLVPWTHTVDLYGNIRIALKPFNIASTNTVLIETNNVDTIKIWP